MATGLEIRWDLGYWELHKDAVKRASSSRTQKNEFGSGVVGGGPRMVGGPVTTVSPGFGPHVLCFVLTPRLTSPAEVPFLESP